jgi:antitoxin YefM
LRGYAIFTASVQLQARKRRERDKRVRRPPGLTEPAVLCTVSLYGFLSYPKGIMATHTTYTNARANLATLLNKVTADREIVIIDRRGSESVALIAESELSSLMETAHLLRSPKNARRLLTALRRAQSKKPLTNVAWQR